MREAAGAELVRDPHLVRQAAVTPFLEGDPRGVDPRIGSGDLTQPQGIEHPVDQAATGRDLNDELGASLLDRHDVDRGGFRRAHEAQGRGLIIA